MYTAKSLQEVIYSKEFSQLLGEMNAPKCRTLGADP